jgi:hypothetical protein
MELAPPPHVVLPTIREFAIMKFVECAVIAVMMVALSVPTAEAKGCLKGALIGGVAGHYAGHHGVLGAAAGCAIGHHEANKSAREHQGAQQPSLQR